MEHDFDTHVLANDLDIKYSHHLHASSGFYERTEKNGSKITLSTYRFYRDTKNICTDDRIVCIFLL